MKKVAIVMGSDNDFPVVKKCAMQLKKFGIPYEVRVMSAHRTPFIAEKFATSAIENGFGVIVAAAGMSAHLAGVIAAFTTLTVIALPIKSPTLDGLDSLLSMVNMPKGIPVACVAIDGADNAGILAAQILALSDKDIADKLAQFKKDMVDEVVAKDKALQEEIGKL